jgi:hypothetical protein
LGVHHLSGPRKARTSCAEDSHSAWQRANRILGHPLCPRPDAQRA